MIDPSDRRIGAVDIGGSKIAVGIVSEEGNVLASRECPTEPERGFPYAVDCIARMLRNCAAAAKVGIEGIGIGCTGPVNSATGEIGQVEFLKTWKVENLVAALEAHFDLHIALENDADAAALGEALWGEGRGKTQMLFITVGTGIGAGLVLDGRLYRGAGGAHPEIGHHVIDASGPKCYCGAHGCWEVLAAGPAMTAWMREHTGGASLSAEQICAMAASGNEVAKQLRNMRPICWGLGSPTW